MAGRYVCNDEFLDMLSEQIAGEQERLIFARRRKTVVRLLSVLAALALASALLLYGVGFAGVVGDSMFPTFRQGDVAVYLRVPRNYQSQDIILFIPESGGAPLIKRVIAVGGDTVDVDESTGRVTVNGRLLEEPYVVNHGWHQNSTDFPLTVPEGQLFVLGDNRDEALDSRNAELGTIPAGRVRGTVLTILRMRF